MPQWRVFPPSEEGPIDKNINELVHCKVSVEGGRDGFLLSHPFSKSVML
jgi:hypothetical protein